MAMKFRTKPIEPHEVHAMQWDGKNQTELAEFAGDILLWNTVGTNPTIRARTAEKLSRVHLQVSDWIVKGPAAISGDEFYIVPDIAFKENFEAIEN